MGWNWSIKKIVFTKTIYLPAIGWGLLLLYIYQPEILLLLLLAFLFMPDIIIFTIFVSVLLVVWTTVFCVSRKFVLRIFILAYFSFHNARFENILVDPAVAVIVIVMYYFICVCVCCERARLHSHVFIVHCRTEEAYIVHTFETIQNGSVCCCCCNTTKWK